MPNSLDEHLSYTDSDLNSLKYYKDIFNFLKNKNIENILDAGGCTGQVSAVLLHEIPSIKNIIILEPVLENYNYIVEKMREVNTANIEVVKKALFYGEPQIKLGQCDSNVGGWSFQHTGNQTDFVDTITLEDFKDIDFAKIDIEGAEKNVIPNSKYINEIAYLEIEFHDDLIPTWKNFTKKYLKNHKLKFSAFDGIPERPQAFFVRKDLYEK